MARDVAAAGKVIGTLGEAGGHSIGTLQDAHCWLNIIDIPACTAQEGGSASKGHFTVGRGFHLHIAALCVLTSQPWWVSNGSVRILTIEGAGAVAAHGAFDVIFSGASLCLCLTLLNIQVVEVAVGPPFRSISAFQGV